MESPQYSIRIEARKVTSFTVCRRVVSLMNGRRTSDVADNLRKASCTERTGQGNDFELIPTVKLETRHPVEGYFGSGFPAICNHYGVITA